MLVTDIIKYFGCDLGAQTKYDKASGTSIVNGAHDTARLVELLESFIKKYVLPFAPENIALQLCHPLPAGMADSLADNPFFMCHLIVMLVSLATQERKNVDVVSHAVLKAHNSMLIFGPS